MEGWMELPPRLPKSTPLILFSTEGSFIYCWHKKSCLLAWGYIHAINIFLLEETEMDLLRSNLCLFAGEEVSKRSWGPRKIPQWAGVTAGTGVNLLDLSCSDFHVGNSDAARVHGRSWALEMFCFPPAMSPECVKPSHSLVTLCPLLPLS